MKNMLAVLSVSSALFLGSAFSLAAEDELQAGGGGTDAPEVSVEIINTKEYGEKFSLAAHKDRILILEFWATWCPPCRKTIPHLSELQRKYEGKVVVIGVSTEERKVVEKFYAAQKDMKYRVAVDKDQKTSDAYMGRFKVDGIPHAFLIRGGKIEWHGHPMELDGQIEKLLKGGRNPSAEPAKEEKGK